MLKNILMIIGVCISVSSFSQSDKIKFKKTQVFVNEVHVLDSDKIQGKTGCTLRTKGTDKDDVIIYWTDLNNGGQIYTVFNFPKLGIKVEYGTYGSNKGYIKLLMKEGVITENGTFNEEEIQTFALKYHENISR